MSDPGLVGAADPAADPKKVTDPASSVSRADPAGTGSEAQANIDAAPADDAGTPRLERLDREDAAQTQFPSLHGQSGVEIAERSADVARPATKKHRKIFRVFTAGLDFAESAFDHRPNMTATRQYMASHGLRPIGDVAFVGAKPYDEKNVDLTYEVEAVPAQVASDPGQVHTVVSQD